MITDDSFLVILVFAALFFGFAVVACFQFIFMLMGDSEK